MADNTNPSGANQFGANQLQVRLVTPDKILVNGPAAAVELPGRTGYLEPLPGAAPLLTELGAGEVRIHGGPNGDETYFVAWGFAEVLPDRVTILAEQAIKPEQIDRPAAEAQRKEGEKLWQQAGDNPAAYQHANDLIYEAEAKLANGKG